MSIYVCVCPTASVCPGFAEHAQDNGSSNFLLPGHSIPNPVLRSSYVVSSHPSEVSRSGLHAGAGGKGYVTNRNSWRLRRKLATALHRRYICGFMSGTQSSEVNILLCDRRRNQEKRLQYTNAMIDCSEERDYSELCSEYLK